METVSMETVSTWVLGKTYEHNFWSKVKAKKSFDVSRHIPLQMSKYKKNSMYNPYTLYNI